MIIFIYKKIIFYLIIFLFLDFFSLAFKVNVFYVNLFNLNAFAASNMYMCNINLIQPKQEVAIDNIGQYVERFSFDNKGEGAGIKSKFHDIEMFVWNQKNELHLIVKDLKRKIDIQTSFKVDQDDIFVRLSPEPEVKAQCITIKKWETLEDESLKALFSLPQITDESKLSYYTSKIQVVVKKEIVFKFHQSQTTGPGAERMEEMFFQSGSIVPDNVNKDNNKEWCIFQIQRKMDEDTTVPAGTKLPVVTVTSSSASKEHYGFNYNFVDFSAGKKSFETFDFVPFVLKCKIRNGVILTKKYFKGITGNYFDIVLNTGSDKSGKSNK